MKHYLEIISEKQAIAMKDMKVGDKVNCAGRIEEVIEVTLPSFTTRAPNGEESKYMCMIGEGRK